MLRKIFHVMLNSKSYTYQTLRAKPLEISYILVKFFILYVKYMYELQDIGGDLHNTTLQVCVCACTQVYKFVRSLIFTEKVDP